MSYLQTGEKRQDEFNRRGWAMLIAKSWSKALGYAFDERKAFRYELNGLVIYDDRWRDWLRASHVA